MSMCEYVCVWGGGGHCGVVVSALDVRSEGHFFEAHGPCHRVVSLDKTLNPTFSISTQGPVSRKSR